MDSRDDIHIHDIHIGVMDLRDDIHIHDIHIGVMDLRDDIHIHDIHTHTRAHTYMCIQDATGN